MTSIPRAKNFEEISNVAGAVPTSTRPMTGEEYTESLRDGTEIYLYGDRVKDVTSHPAFRNSVRMTARLYDALHDLKTREIVTCPSDTGSDGYTMRFFVLLGLPKTWWEIATQSLPGHGSPKVGWGEVQTTKRLSSAHSARTQTSIYHLAVP